MFPTLGDQFLFSKVAYLRCCQVVCDSLCDSVNNLMQLQSTTLLYTPLKSGVDLYTHTKANCYHLGDLPSQWWVYIGRVVLISILVYVPLSKLSELSEILLVIRIVFLIVRVLNCMHVTVSVAVIDNSVRVSESEIPILNLIKNSIPNMSIYIHVHVLLYCGLCYLVL